MENLPLVSVVIPTHNRKEKVKRLLRSILQSSYPKEKLEIIVVDDASTDGTYEEIRREFPDIKVLRNDKERWLAGSRNIGIKVSRGKYILLIDDDNIVDEHMIEYLVECMEKNPNVGVCAPLMLYHGSDIIWCAGIRRNMITSKTTYLFNGKSLRDVSLPEIIESSDDFPNCFMIRAKIVKKYGILFNEEEFPIHYDEADFCYRVRKLGYRVVCYTKARVWHDVKRSIITGFETETRTYYTARNRIVFHKKYSKRWQYMLFVTIFNWLITSYYLSSILLESKKSLVEKGRIIKAYFKGVIDGLKR